MDLAARFKKCISLMDVLAHLIGCIIKCESKILYISKPTDFSSILENSVLDLGLIPIGSLGPRATTKVESHVNFTESQKVSQSNFFAILNTEK